MNVQHYINRVTDPAVRHALQAIFDQLRADLDANVAKFNDHTHHDGTAYTSKPATDAPGNSTGTRSTFQQNLSA